MVKKFLRPWATASVVPTLLRYFPPSPLKKAPDPPLSGHLYDNDFRTLLYEEIRVCILRMLVYFKV